MPGNLQNAVATLVQHADKQTGSKKTTRSSSRSNSPSPLNRIAGTYQKPTIPEKPFHLRKRPVPKPRRTLMPDHLVGAHQKPTIPEKPFHLRKRPVPKPRYDDLEKTTMYNSLFALKYPIRLPNSIRHFVRQPLSARRFSRLHVISKKHQKKICTLLDSIFDARQAMCLAIATSFFRFFLTGEDALINTPSVSWEPYALTNSLSAQIKIIFNDFTPQMFYGIQYNEKNPSYKRQKNSNFHQTEVSSPSEFVEKLKNLPIGSIVLFTRKNHAMAFAYGKNGYFFTDYPKQIIKKNNFVEKINALIQNGTELLEAVILKEKYIEPIKHAHHPRGKYRRKTPTPSFKDPLLVRSAKNCLSPITLEQGRSTILHHPYATRLFFQNHENDNDVLFDITKKFIASNDAGSLAPFFLFMNALSYDSGFSFLNNYPTMDNWENLNLAEKLFTLLGHTGFKASRLEVHHYETYSDEWEASIDCYANNYHKHQKKMLFYWNNSIEKPSSFENLLEDRSVSYSTIKKAFHSSTIQRVENEIGLLGVGEMVMLALETNIYLISRTQKALLIVIDGEKIKNDLDSVLIHGSLTDTQITKLAINQCFTHKALENFHTTLKKSDTCVLIKLKNSQNPLSTVRGFQNLSSPITPISNFLKWKENYNPTSVFSTILRYNPNIPHPEHYIALKNFWKTGQYVRTEHFYINLLLQSLYSSSYFDRKGVLQLSITADKNHPEIRLNWEQNDTTIRYFHNMEKIIDIKAQNYILTLYEDESYGEMRRKQLHKHISLPSPNTASTVNLNRLDFTNTLFNLKAFESILMIVNETKSVLLTSNPDSLQLWLVDKDHAFDDLRTHNAEETDAQNLDGLYIGKTAEQFLKNIFNDSRNTAFEAVRIGKIS